MQQNMTFGHEKSAEFVGKDKSLLFQEGRIVPFALSFSGAALCASCFVSAICLSLLDWYVSKKLRIQEVKNPTGTVGLVSNIENYL